MTTLDVDRPSLSTPAWRIALFQCQKGHVLGGMFVLFRPKLEEDIIPGAVAAVRDLLRSKLRRPYTLGLTSEKGYLGPVDFDPKKFASLVGLSGSPNASGMAPLAELIPDSYRFVAGRAYEFYFIQHPDVALAKQIQVHVNEGSDDYGKPQVLVPEPSGLVKIGAQEEEDPTAFLPRGGELYGGWCLFNGMPSARCTAVKKQVRKLQAHLGALRYLVGNGNWPYLFDAGTDSDQSGGDNDGIFDVRVMSAAHAFQKHACATSTEPPFQVDDPKPHEALVDYGADFAPKLSREARVAKRYEPPDPVSNSWAYLKGQSLPTAPAPHPERTDGVVDASTAAAIKNWLEKGLRKPGAILTYFKDPRGWGSWLRADGGRAWYAWSEAAKILGFPEGICANHCYRSAQVDVTGAGYGRAVASIHKSGLAIDIGMYQFVRADKPWPVAYVRENVGSQTHWRLYAPSTLPLPSSLLKSSAEALATSIRTRLRTWRKEESIPDEMAVDFNNVVRHRLMRDLSDPETFFRSFFKTTITPWVYDGASRDGGSPYRSVTGQEFYANHRAYYLEASVIPALESKVKALDDDCQLLKAQKQAEPNEKKASRIQAALDKKQRELDRSKQEFNDAKAELFSRRRQPSMQTPAVGSGTGTGSQGWVSFLDLTRLGELCGLNRICSFTSGWQRTLRTMNVSSLSNIATAVKDAKKVMPPDAEIFVTRGKIKRAWPLHHIDDAFVSDWVASLAKAAKTIPFSVRCSPPRLLVTLSLDKSRDGDAGAVADVFQQYQEKYFYATPIEPGTPAIRKGSKWAEYLRTLGRRLQETRQKRTADAAARKAVSRLSPLPPNQATSSLPGPNYDPHLPPFEKWMASFQPIFLLNYVPPEIVNEMDIPMMPGDSVGTPGVGQPIGMEWWHFQRGDLIKAVPWGELLVAIGWTLEGLLGDAAPSLYERKGVGYKAETLGRISR